MPNQNPNNATVRHALLPGKKVPECLVILDNTCAAGAQCPEVQASPIAAQALGGLQSALATTHVALGNRTSLGLELTAAIRALLLDFTALQGALRTYEAAVNVIAKGDANVINKAGLLSRDKSVPVTALGKVAVVYSKPGKHPGEAIITWPRGPGATGYALEVNYAPQNPTGSWSAIAPGTSRRRVVKGQAPATPFLVRIASMGSDGSQAEWSDPILATPL